jgi:hypothetical protein
MKVLGILGVFTVSTALAFAAVHPVRAQNLVQDPGFESSVSSGDGEEFGTTNPYWTIGSGADTFFETCGQCNNVNNPGPNGPYNGNWYATFPETTSDSAFSSALTQVIPTTPGATYLVSFFLANNNSPDNFFTVTFDGQTVLSLTNQQSFTYQQFSALITVTDSQSTLSFVGEQVPGEYNLDDVSVTEEGAPAPNVGSGIASLALLPCLYALRRRHQAQQRRLRLSA